MIEDQNNDEILNLFYENYSLQKVIPEFGLFCPSDTDTVDNENMEKGIYYAIFYEEDLFIKIKSKIHNKMIKAGINPIHARWSVFG